MESSTDRIEIKALSASAIQGASPELRRFVSMTAQEITEARRRVMARPLVAASLKAQSGFESAGVVSARVVDKLRLMAILQKNTD